MKATLFILHFTISIVIILCSSSCTVENETICGCINPYAVNYNAEAETDDGSCIFETTLCFYVGCINTPIPVDVYVDGVYVGKYQQD